MRTELFWMHRQGVCGDGRRNLGAWFNDVHTLYPCVSGLDLIPLGLHSAPCMIPRKGSAELLLLLNPGTFLPWANSYLLEILRPKNWTLTTQKFWEILQFTNWNQVWFFSQQNIFLFYYGKRFSHFSIKKVFPCTSYSPHLDMLILINSNFLNTFNCTSQRGIHLLCPFTPAKV